MAAVFTFENGKQIFFDRTVYANGEYVLFKDYQLLDEERRAVRNQLTRANNQIDDLKEQIAKLEKTRSSWSDNAVEWREKCEKAEKQIKKLECELRKKDNSENDGLDFTEHDKGFKDEIESLKRKIEKLASIRTRCHESARASFDLGMYGSLHIVTDDELKTTKDENDRTVGLPFDALETANMLINATYKAEIPFLEKQVDRNVYDIDDLEQIAEHLLVYCKHNMEDEE